MLKCRYAVFYIEDRKVPKKKKGKHQQNTEGEFRVPLPGEDELYGVVIQLLGASMLLVKCQDGKTRRVRIPGKLRKRMWCKVGDVVTVRPWYGMNPDEKADLTNRFRQNQVDWLIRNNLLPEELQV